jgi:8-oxo-dGTP diphosphatase
LRLAFTIRPIAFELLPKEFTLNEFQNLYEQVFDIKVDNRNFRKKLKGFSFIRPLAKKATGGKHRPALLHTFHFASYKKFQKERLF